VDGLAVYAGTVGAKQGERLAALFRAVLQKDEMARGSQKNGELRAGNVGGEMPTRLFRRVAYKSAT